MEELLQKTYWTTEDKKKAIEFFIFIVKTHRQALRSASHYSELRNVWGTRLLSTLTPQEQNEVAAILNEVGG